MTAAAHEATLERVLERRPGTRSLFLRLPADRPLAFTPGQFVSIELAGDDGRPLARAYSIASSPADGHLLELVVDRVPRGAASERLFGLAAGATLAFKGPFGTFTWTEPPDGEAVFVADASAIAPIRPMLHLAAARSPAPAMLVLHGARTPDELLFRDELEALPGVRYEPILSHRGQAVGDHPELEALVAERFIAADGDRRRHFWVCAVGAMVRRLREALRAAGYERRAVRYEQW